MKAYIGFKGGRKMQGGWIGVAIAGVGLANQLFGGGGSGGGPSPGQIMQATDPYGPYRGAAATRLNSLMANPSSITSLPEYNAAMQGVQRQMAAQGYLGSGNALTAAADASGQAYQQAFNNLAMLAGANYAPGSGMGTAANVGQQNWQNQQYWLGQLGTAVGNNSYLNGFFGGGGMSTTPGQYGYSGDASGSLQYMDGLAYNIPGG